MRRVKLGALLAGLAVLAFAATATARPKTSDQLLLLLNGQPVKLGTLTSSGSGVTNATTATTFTLVAGSVLLIQCDAPANVMAWQHRCRRRHGVHHHYQLVLRLQAGERRRHPLHGAGRIHHHPLHDFALWDGQLCRLENDVTCCLQSSRSPRADGRGHSTSTPAGCCSPTCRMALRRRRRSSFWPQGSQHGTGVHRLGADWESG